MKKNYFQVRYDHLVGLYKKYNNRLEKHFKQGSFRLLSKQKQQQLLVRIEKIKLKLNRLERAAQLSGIALMFGLSLATREAQGQTPVLGSEFKVNAYTTGNQKNSDVAIDSDGDFVVVWQSQTQDGHQNGIIAQRYNAWGVAQGAEFIVNTFTTSDQSAPSVAMDSDGDFVVVWQSADQEGDSYGVYGQRFNASGAALGSEFRVNTYTSFQQSAPSVAMDSDGDFVVVWNSRIQDGSDYGIYAQRYDASGAAQGSEFKVNTHTTNYQYFPSIAMDSDGDFVVAWISRSQDGSGYGIYAQRYNALGSAQGSEFKVNTHTTNNQSSPSVAMDSDGDFVVVWDSYLQDGSIYGIYAQRYDASGAAQGSEFKVNTYTTASQYYPEVALRSNGDFVVTWQSDSQDGSGDGVYGQQYDAAGLAQGGEFRINTTTISSQRSPSVAMDSEGDFVVIWESYQDGSLAGIYAQRYGTSAPSISAQSFSIAENSANATSVGTVVASDADAGQTLTYAITAGNTGSVFAINSSTGEITVAGALDYEVTTTYSLTVQVTDNGSPVKSTSATITINITDVNEATSVFQSNTTFIVGLYPNPAKSVVHLDVKGEAQVRILDLRGQLIQESSLINAELSVAGIPQGTYLLEVTQQDRVMMGKLVIE